MGVEAILVKVEYDKSKPVQNGMLPIKKIIQVPMQTYRDEAILGYAEDSSSWQSFTHQQAQVEGKKSIVQIAFLVDMGEEREIDIYIGPYERNKNKDEKLITYFQGDKVYYFLPSVFDSKKRIKTDRGTSDVVCSGVFYVRIYNKGNLVIQQPTIILPSGMSLRQYTLLLEDLVGIHQDLIIDTNSKLSVVEKWKVCNKDLREQIDILEILLKRINKRPEVKLEAEWIKLPMEKVKHLSKKTIIEKKLFCKSKVKAVNYESSMDLYEHRIIKKHIKSLLNTIKRYSILEIKELNSIIEETKSSVNDKFEFNTNRYNELQQRMKEINIRKENTIQEMIQSYNQMNVFIELFRGDKGISCEIPLWLIEQPRCERTDGGEMIYVKNRDYDRSSKKFLPFDTEFEKFVYDNNNFQYQSKKVSIIGIKTHDLWQQYFFKYCLEGAVNRQKKIILVGEVDINTFANPQLPFAKYTGGDFPDYEIILNKIHAIKVENYTYYYKDFKQKTSFTLYEICEKLIEEYNNDIQKVEEELGFYYALENKKELFDMLKNDVAVTCENKWSELENRLYKLLKLRYLKDVPDVQEKLYPSTLFRRHKDYQRIYQYIKRFNKRYEGIDLRSGKELLIGKTEKLYEYWCFVKMVKIFIEEYRFEIVCPLGKKELSEQIKMFLQSGQLEESHIILESKEIGMKTTIWFNKKLITEQGNNYLTPDYYFEIGFNGKNYYICMDAKYRDYSAQTVTQWIKDMKNVAMEKYIRKLQKSGYQISGSYIVHNDISSNSMYRGFELKQYYGFKPYMIEMDYNSIDGSAQNMQSLLIMNHQVGSVAFLPENTFYFKNLIRMIMEYHLKIYKQKCWICGNDKLEVVTKHTRSGYEKYHVTCKECGEFWVKTHCIKAGCNKDLVKHLNNYHQQIDKKERWFVECPSCV